MRLYEIKWYVNDKLTETKCEAYWCESDLTDRYDKFISGIGDIVRYEYEYIKDIKLPDDLLDFSNAKF